MANMSTRAPRMAGSRRATPRPAAAGTLPPPPKNWTTVKDVASRCSVHVSTVYEWCHLNQVVARRVGSSWRVRLASDGFPMPADSAERAA